MAELEFITFVDEETFFPGWIFQSLKMGYNIGLVNIT